VQQPALRRGYSATVKVLFAQRDAGLVINGGNGATTGRMAACIWRGQGFRRRICGGRLAAWWARFVRLYV
jgi:hypothetical protein